MEVVLGYLWSPMLVKLGDSETEDFLMTSFSMLKISYGKQTNLFSFNMYKI